MKAFVLATGPSLTREQVNAVHGRGLVIAVSDAYRLAPWADALVSTDKAWWFARPEAADFMGRKFSAVDTDGRAERVFNVPSGINSGLLATKVAVMLGATTVVLLGLDLQGTHFFGSHAAPLINSTDAQFDRMREQFAEYQPDGIEILNASPASSLKCYRSADLRDWV